MVVVGGGDRCGGGGCCGGGDMGGGGVVVHFVPYGGWGHVYVVRVVKAREALFKWWGGEGG